MLNLLVLVKICQQISCNLLRNSIKYADFKVTNMELQCVHLRLCNNYVLFVGTTRLVMQMMSLMTTVGQCNCVRLNALHSVIIII